MAARCQDDPMIALRLMRIECGGSIRRWQT